jgi:hypothetical protein
MLRRRLLFSYFGNILSKLETETERDIKRMSARSLATI